MIEYKVKNNDIYLIGTENFELPHTLDCGQAFRWSEKEDGVWYGVAFNKYLELKKNDDGSIILFSTLIPLPKFEAFFNISFELIAVIISL